MRVKLAERKIERAIDLLVQLQDGGEGCDTITRILEMLNALLNKIQARGAS